ncbi:papain family cysteine protease (macronuclear) [Tetrahymena thermophila SB210]|uniref:Papain family cysteine protease n=1 Tax=Tetrahymena thermophila (strain SB210) TaxID=312017 RepID=I7M1U0_TETTS|nr:papain family cysteine protease [Tetrahymena thermophila SB210]EAR97576.1 papain family cysteine protease [Tetrahymena thermophila SB210]|eukprot:XP_001017821.1 papain family cysteine protease [Tetrahymena thermophila SB210]
MNKILVSALICLMIATPSVFCQDLDDNISENVKVQDLLAYNKWRFNYKRIYLNEEEQIYRQIVFFENLARISQHSSEKSYSKGLNQFSDMTKEEFRHRILNKKLSQKSNNADNGRNLAADPAVSNLVFPTNNLPLSVDWRKKGVLNPVKDQGQCGSCWTFATAGILESFNQIKNKKLVKFSEQQLVDCVHLAGYHSDGCDGGFQEEGVRYAIKYGIVQSSKYPYVGYQGRCRVTAPLSHSLGFYPQKFQPINKTEADLKAALVFSPVSVSVDATNWNDYIGGVFDECGDTTERDLNHAVIAVGYDQQGNWIIRNSWSAAWGENGYIRLAPGNTCGVLLDNLVVTQ